MAATFQIVTSSERETAHGARQSRLLHMKSAVSQSSLAEPTSRKDADLRHLVTIIDFHLLGDGPSQDRHSLLTYSAYASATALILIDADYALWLGFSTI